MCLALPMKIKIIKNDFAEAESCGILKKINIKMVPGIKIGEYCLVHAGFAIQKLDAEKAKETLKFIDEIR